MIQKKKQSYITKHTLYTNNTPCTKNTLWQCRYQSTAEPEVNNSKHVKDFYLEANKAIQGYLAHEKPPAPLGPPQGPRHRPTVGS